MLHLAKHAMKKPSLPRRIRHDNFSWHPITKRIMIQKCWFVILMSLPLAAGTVPRVGMVRPESNRVERYGRFEAALDVTGMWTNPFDSDQIAVDAEFQTPSGQQLTTPCFWSRAYTAAPSATPGQAVDFLKLFIKETSWRAGSEVTLFVDDVALIRADGSRETLEDFERNPVQRWYGGPKLEWTAQPVHGCAHALSWTPTITAVEHWPGVLLPLPKVDWRAYRGVELWVYPHTASLGPIELYYHDAVTGNSQIANWEPGDQWRPNRWNKLTWLWRTDPPRLQLKPDAPAGWRVRFTPREVGRYQLTVTACEGGQTARSVPVAFDVTPSANHGFVRLATEDPRYFVFDDGTAFFPVGHDVPWGVDNVLRYFPRMKEHEENATYFIQVSWDELFEWAKLGDYDLDRAARLDRVINAARDNGIYLKLSFDVHDAFRPSKAWLQNPYNAIRGGPCQTVNDFYTSPAAFAQYAKRLRYIAARWGYSTHIMAWEPFAEIDGATSRDSHEGWGYPDRPGGEQVSQMLAAWLPKVAAELHRYDPYGRMFTCSFGSGVSDPRVWRLPDIAYTQIHQYGVADIAASLGQWARTLTVEHNKAMMVTEFGWETEAIATSTDPNGICLHDGLWASVCSGAAGGALNWWWERIAELDLDRWFPPLQRFIAGVDWPREKFRPVQAQVLLPPIEHWFPVVVQPAAPFGGGSQGPHVIERDGHIADAQQLPVNLLAPGTKFQVVRPQFDVDCPVPGRFEVLVDAVSPNTRLDVLVDGRLVLRQDLPAEQVPGKVPVFDPQYKVWHCDYHDWYGVDLAAGRHRIEVANSWPTWSWIRVGGYRLSAYSPPAIQVYGLTGRTSTLAWLHDRAVSWKPPATTPPLQFKDVRLTLTGLPDGPQRAEWFDTYAGRVIATEVVTVRRGALTLIVPPLSKDLALRLGPERR